MTLEGVDSTVAIDPAALKAAGKSFIIRYGGPGGDWKHLTADELRAYQAAGIPVVANAEGSSDGLKLGYSAGVAWATSARDFFQRTLGWPTDRPIYFSVDFDTTSDDWNELDAAFDGIASVIGRAQTGVYGEYSIVEHFAANGKAPWRWQTYAWSNFKVSDKIHLYQYRNSVPFGGTTVDFDRAMVADYGQWTGEDMTPVQAQQLLDIHYAMFTKGTGHPTISVAGKVEATQAQVNTLAAQPPVVAAPIDPAALKAVLLDPEVLNAIATAVVTLHSDRLAS